MKIKLSDIRENKISPEQAEELRSYFQAGGTWAELLKLNDGEIEELYAVGHKFYTEGNFDQALASFSTLIQLNPYVAKHWLSIGAALQAQEKYEDALAAYQTALSLEERSDLHFYLAQVLYALERKEEAIIHLEKVVERGEAPFSEKAQEIIRVLRSEQ